jgi:hypothetical protein
MTQQLAIGRMAVGIAGFVAPRTFGRFWMGAEAATPQIAPITRAFAVRDFALGLGAFLAIQKGTPVRGWLEAGLLSDAADTYGALRSPAPMIRKLAMAAASLSGVAGGVLALRQGQERSPVV